MSRPKNPPRLVKMSELSRLSEVPAPTIKHYIREGLLPEPAKRTSRNMAYYDASLADRIRAIKSIQQTQYLPLRLIGELLEPAPSAEFKERARDAIDTYIPAILAGEDAARKQRKAGALPARLSVAQVTQQLGVTSEELKELDRLGLASPSQDEEGKPVYEGADRDILQIIDDLRRDGLGESFPFEVLSPYMEQAGRLARFELDLFRRQVLEQGNRDGEEIRAMGAKAMALGERLLVAMRAKLMLPQVGVLLQNSDSTKRGGANERSKTSASPRKKKSASPAATRAKKTSASPAAGKATKRTPSPATSTRKTKTPRASSKAKKTR